MAREYEYQKVWFDRGTSRTNVRVSLSIQASYGDWELMRSRVFPDGRRYVELRRRARPGLPTFSL